MEVVVTVGEGEDLTIGIKTGSKKNNGSVSTNDNAGWFKVDYFRIHKIEGAGIGDVAASDASSIPSGVYNLFGQLVGSGEADLARLPKGIYIFGGKKVAVK